MKYLFTRFAYTLPILRAVVMDERGYVKVVGRIKDIIIRGGENISPREIEEFLYQHPGVQVQSQCH